MSNRRLARECALQALYYADSLKDMPQEDVLDYAADYRKELGEYFPF